MTSARDGAREAATAALLDAVVTSRLPGWLDHSGPVSDPDWDGGLEVLALALSMRWQDASRLADRMPAVPDDDQDAWWLRRAASWWAASGDPAPCGPLSGGVEGGPSYDSALGRLAAHLVVEAVLAHARLDLAVELAERYAPALAEPLVLCGEPHAFGLMAGICRARVLAFAGDVGAATVVLASLPPAEDGPLRAVLAGTVALVKGNDADPGTVREAVADVDRYASEPDDHLGAGAQLLASFGEIALANTAAAARRVLVAGGDSDLARLNVADRALGLEMLVVLALADDDLDAAEAWLAHLEPLVASPISDATAARAMSRVALHAGRVGEAVVWGERAVVRARAAHRLIEYAEGEIVLNRARLEHAGSSGGVAARALASMVEESERRGHGAARRAAGRVLKASGRRLPPVAGSGWTGLTAREAEVARLVARGATSAEVAGELHLSRHTVHAHVARVLSAFAVPTRSALPAAMAEAASGAPADRALQLTARQEQVAALVAQGLPNDRVAVELGVSRRTVERHVSDILGRWGLASRTALARTWHDRAG